MVVKIVDLTVEAAFDELPPTEDCLIQKPDKRTRVAL
jgi:hypothetical protein